MRCEFHGWKHLSSPAQFVRRAFRTILSFQTTLLCLSIVSILCAPVLASSNTSLSEPSGAQSSRVDEPVYPLLRAGLSGDSDNDGIPDIIDIDDDNDTITDDIEGTSDTDGDGIVDCLDTDSDNDGIPDLIEAFSGSGLLFLIDTDRNGRMDANVSVGENGLANVIETAPESGLTDTGNFDFDGDGIRDQHDLDSDNDGIPDVVEAGSSDIDFNGLYDFFLDLNGDGLADRLFTLPIRARDTDEDGAADFRDWDSDQDGLTDLLETSGEDVDGDGKLDNFIDFNIDGLSDGYSDLARNLIDTDQDGLPDYRDTDSDGDGVTDSEEAFEGTVVPMPVTPDSVFMPTPTEPITPVTLETGESGSVFGCSILNREQSQRFFDPLFLLMIFIATFVCLGRNRIPIRALPASRTGVLALLSVLMLSACSTPGPTLSNSDRQAMRAYAGLGLGASFLNANTTGLDIDQDESISAAGQLTLGLTLSDSYALELRAADLGEATFTTGEAVGYQVADVSALYRRRFSGVSGFARLGAGALFNDGDIPTTQKNKSHLLVGVGAEYAFSPQLALRGEWQGHDVDVMHTQLSLLFRFGRSTARSNPVVIAQKMPTESQNSKPAQSDTANESLNRQGKSATAEQPAPAPLPQIEPKPVPQAKPEEVAEPSEDTQNSSSDSEKLALLEQQAPMIEPSNASRGTSVAAKPRLKPLITVPIEENNAPISIDIDKDGIVDASDSCPGTRAGVPVLENGCSIFGEPVPGLSFFPGTDRLTDSAVGVLDSLAKSMDEQSDLQVTVAAHTKASADSTAAMFLTRRRTIAIIRYLSEQGIDATRLRPEAYGDTLPLENAVQPSDNDRVVLTLR